MIQAFDNPTRNYICLMLVLALLLSPLAALADDSDPSGEKLKALYKDPKFLAALKAQGDSGDVNAEISYWRWRCHNELLTVVGAVIWGVRACFDNCPKYCDILVIDYCELYSRTCDHWHWNAGCLSQYGCPDPPPY